MSYEHEPELEFQAPPYSIIGKQIIGLEIITYAIMDGEWPEFVRPLKLTDVYDE